MSSVSQFRVDEEALNYHKHQTTKIKQTKSWHQGVYIN